MNRPKQPQERGHDPEQPSYYLTDAQLRAEIARCEYCEDKPCMEACPADCSPADFIRAVQLGEAADYRRAAALIMGKNPLGGICGMVCPDKHCMAACVHRGLDGPIDIPRVQATIVQRAKKLEVMPEFDRVPHNGEAVGIIGGGPAGLAAAAYIVQHGYGVTICDEQKELGGMCRAIPEFRLEREALDSDLLWLQSLGKVRVQMKRRVDDPLDMLDEGHDAVLIATGLWKPIALGIAGEQAAIGGIEFLLASADDERLSVDGANVAVIGGGATAFDCAMTAAERGAARVEILALETFGEMPLAENERRALIESEIDVSGRTRVERIEAGQGDHGVAALTTVKVRLDAGAEGFDLSAIEAVAGSEARRADIDRVIVAIGSRPGFDKPFEHPKVFHAGDCVEGPTTVVEAAAAGKNAAKKIVDYLDTRQTPVEAATPRSSLGAVKSQVQIPGYDQLPVSLACDFFGRQIRSPLLLSAAPPSDGLEQMQLAYEAGWPGGVMKTAFDNVPIHIPGEYMFAFDQGTYANCDNVSGHSLERVCREIEQLVREWPDRLTIGSTGGPVSGDDEADAAAWQGNTRKLEQAGAMGIEYSLSCPQGGDGTEGDIVSQNAELTAKIIDWILATSDPAVPKLFKLTGAVTSIEAIAIAIKGVFDRYPTAKAGITLANTFPTLSFRVGPKLAWEEGIVVGMSGQGALNISYLTLAKVAHLGLTVSGNGGPMDYRAIADFLALGARTVQLCTVVMKSGYHVIDDLHAGLSHLMAARSIRSVDELVGRALPDPIADFMELPAAKKISSADRQLCLRCGNCARCPYLAISADADGYPKTDPSRCIGCGICSLKCFAGAISMRPRSAEEAAALKEE